MSEIRKHFTSSSWVEGRALEQIEEVSKLPGVRSVSGFPDLHPGKYGPVGATVEADRIYPLLVGNDIGCGMALFRLDVPPRKLKAEKCADRLRGLEGTWEGDAAARLEEAGLSADVFPYALGTIGGGNHFCELQAVHERIDDNGPESGSAWLLVHSGSRGLGTAVLDALPQGVVAGLDPDSEEAASYIEAHDRAVRWAALNRRIIAERAAGLLRADLEAVCDVPHNLVELRDGLWLHRKGAAKADADIVPIAGSRATLSYAVAPGPGIAMAHHSLSHGSGRKYDRASMAGRVGRTRSEREALSRNQWGGHIVCEDRQLLIEEAPEAYKDAGRVVADLLALGLARPLASFRPVVTFKRANTVDEEERGGGKDRWDNRRPRR